MNGFKEIGEQADVEIVRSGKMCALKIHREGLIPLSGYKMQNSADGETELCITIKGITNELKASLTVPKK